LWEKTFVPSWIVLKEAVEVDKAYSKKGSKRLKRLKQLKQCASQEGILQALKARGSQYASRSNRFSMIINVFLTIYISDRQPYAI